MFRGPQPAFEVGLHQVYRRRCVAAQTSQWCAGAGRRRLPVAEGEHPRASCSSEVPALHAAAAAASADRAAWPRPGRQGPGVRGRRGRGFRIHGPDEGQRGQGRKRCVGGIGNPAEPGHATPPTAAASASGCGDHAPVLQGMPAARRAPPWVSGVAITPVLSRSAGAVVAVGACSSTVRRDGARPNLVGAQEAGSLEARRTARRAGVPVRGPSPVRGPGQQVAVALAESVVHLATMAAASRRRGAHQKLTGLKAWPTCAAGLQQTSPDRRRAPAMPSASATPSNQASTVQAPPSPWSAS